MLFGSNQTFEPRAGTAQLIFGVIYLLITLTALMLALYTRQTQGDEPWLHYCMAFLFALMALKSFIIHARVKSLLRNGVYYEAKVESCEAKRGITVITGTCDVKDYGLIHIESRLVGETVAHELNRFLQDNKQQMLPALVVGEKTHKPRGMFTVKCLHGHLIEDSAKLKAQLEAEQAEDGEDGPEQTLTQEILADELAAIAKTKQEQSEQGAEHLEQAKRNADAEAEAEAAKAEGAAADTVAATESKETEAPAAPAKDAASAAEQSKTN